MSSTEIMLNNLKQHFLVNSYRKLAKKINISTSIVLNWSSGRSSPNLKNVDDIAYFLGIATYQLLIPNNTFNIDTPIWKDTLKSNLLNNINRLKYEKDIHESSFYKKVMSDNKMSYRSFLRYANGKNKNINLKKIDIIAEILSVESYKLIESE
ncbi:hypothetical protein DWY77_05005 [Megamonas rupellensis]|jgi:transcriptional regulator with XRE-family HTH domain|uniref:HTH cro/C1-type domain-containing protein n=1 Tax=Megamonas rupellensis TaxID=491921 RepID=A0A412CEZ0_9FIRM|nr:hypothetical protein [Megamonas rupellensis]RGQ84025.1 hypothetical protein DWY77_05005 [Megamonas rupellensis]